MIVELFRPMLASSVTPDLGSIKYPVLASPKLDGIRCVMADGIAYSRSMKRIPNLHVQKTLGELELHGLDGELMVKGDFNAVQSAIMSVSGTPDFVLNVFDDFTLEKAGFQARLVSVQQKIQALDNCKVVAVPHTKISNAEDMKCFWDACVELGYEGAMVRSIDGPYKKGRSTPKQGYLIKLKGWHDDEATITGVEELFHNENEAELGELGQTKRSKCQAGLVAADTLGALRVSYAGKSFKIGTGFDAALRKKLWQEKESLKGKKVTFKYLNLSSYGIPRHPVFKGIRYE